MKEFEEYISKAVQVCLSSTKDCSKAEDVVACLKSQNALVHSKFRYAIAQEIARFFTHRFGSSILSLNLYGSTMEYTAGIYSDIDLILHVSHMDEEIIEITRQLNTLLTEAYYSLLGQLSTEYDYLIDMHIINDDPNEYHQSSRSYLKHILFSNSVALCQ